MTHSFPTERIVLKPLFLVAVFAASFTWNNRSGIPASAEWIWHDTGNDAGGFIPAPFRGFDHDEFLVLRVPGVVPEPASLVLGLSACCWLVVCRRKGK